MCMESQYNFIGQIFNSTSYKLKIKDFITRVVYVIIVISRILSTVD